MASQRLLLLSSSSSSGIIAAQLLSRLSIRQKQTSSYLAATLCKGLYTSANGTLNSISPRLFSSSNGGGNDDSDGKEGKKPSLDDYNISKNHDDPFGVHFDDGEDRLGPTLPPKYKRDAATGRLLTNQIEAELSGKEKRLLKADPVTLQDTLNDRIVADWQDDGKMKGDEKLNRLGRRVRESDMALNVLGRSVRAQGAVEVLEDGKKVGRDNTGFSQHLTPDELKVFNEYMKQQHGSGFDVTDDDIPVLHNPILDVKKKRRTKRRQEEDVNPDETELSLKWLTARSQRQMEDDIPDNPYSDLMPFDLNPTRLVNCRKAKRIPVKLLHHNNVQLLHSYLTPTGQVQNRVLSRLGARDQRKVSKLVRRARAMGLLPYMGQCKIERHGWVHAPDIHTLRPWEQQLIERGLTIQDRGNKKNDDDE